MSVFEYRRGKALNDVLEVIFFCATALFLIIIITCNLLELETTETVRKLLKNKHNNTSIKKLNYFRFVLNYNLLYFRVTHLFKLIIMKYEVFRFKEFHLFLIIKFNYFLKNY